MSRRNAVTIGVCVLITISIVLATCVNFYNQTREPELLIVSPLPIQDIVKVPTGSRIMSNDMYDAIQGVDTVQSYNSYGSYTQLSQTQVIAITASGPNAALYDLADRYYNVYYGSQRVSPIFPLATANVETPGRANNEITWSALFPSAVVPIEQLETFNVVDVATNEDYFKVLSKEYSTRDRGPLQMSPTYGTSNDNLNEMMSGTEVEKLKDVDSSFASSWMKGASSHPGDRFYIPDVCMRLSAANQQYIYYMTKNRYTPTNDMCLIAMLAMGHQNSSIWSQSNHTKSVGQWYSCEGAYTYAKQLSTNEVIKVLSDYAKTGPMFLTYSQAVKICPIDGSKYAKTAVVYGYPIQVLYAYIKLSQLYTGG